MIAHCPHMPYQTPLKLVKILREMGIQKSHTPTCENIDTVKTSIPPQPRTTTAIQDTPFLTFIGEEKRKECHGMILGIINPYESTADLIEAGIIKFYEKYGDYPSQIFLNAFRHFTYGMIVKEHILPLPLALRIPCFYSGKPNCDVILKKEE